MPNNFLEKDKFLFVDKSALEVYDKELIQRREKEINMLLRQLKAFNINLIDLSFINISLEKRNLILNLAFMVVSEEKLLKEFLRKKQLPLEKISSLAYEPILNIAPYEDYLKLYIILIYDEKYSSILKFLNISKKDVPENKIKIKRNEKNYIITKKKYNTEKVDSTSTISEKEFHDENENIVSEDSETKKNINNKLDSSTNDTYISAKITSHPDNKISSHIESTLKNGKKDIIDNKEENNQINKYENKLESENNKDKKENVDLEDEERKDIEKVDNLKEIAKQENLNETANKEDIYSGIIVSKKSSKRVILTTSGEFKLVEKQKYQDNKIGEVIVSNTPKSHKKIIITLIIVLLISFVVLISNYVSHNKVSTTVLFKANAEIKSTFTDDNYLIHAYPINEKGKLILEDSNFEEKDLDYVLGELLEQAYINKIVEELDSITIIISGNKINDDTILEGRLNERVLSYNIKCKINNNGNLIYLK